MRTAKLMTLKKNKRKYLNKTHLKKRTIKERRRSSGSLKKSIVP
jgi:hypothetical protein